MGWRLDTQAQANKITGCGVRCDARIGQTSLAASAYIGAPSEQSGERPSGGATHKCTAGSPSAGRLSWHDRRDHLVTLARTDGSSSICAGI